MDVKPPAPGPAEVAAEKAFREHQAKYKDDADMFVRMGVLANRKEKWVKLAARATSLNHGDAVEFFAVPTGSGKDYEAVAAAFAKASDVHAALEFIGMKAGRPVDSSKDQYWPKGERVIMTMAWEEPAEEKEGKVVKQNVRAEDLIIDRKNKDLPLPREGLIFVGSYWITPEDGGAKIYAADAVDSRAIASDYNERASVLDVPRRAPQGAVYDSQKLNPKHRFTMGQPIEITMEPEHKDGKLRVRELALTVTMVDGKGPGAARCALTDAEGKPINAEPGLIGVLAEFNKIVEANQDPYVMVKVEGTAT